MQIYFEFIYYIFLTFCDTYKKNNFILSIAILFLHWDIFLFHLNFVTLTTLFKLKILFPHYCFYVFIPEKNHALCGTISSCGQSFNATKTVKYFKNISFLQGFFILVENFQARFLHYLYINVI